MSVLNPTSPEQDDHSKIRRAPHLMPEVQWEEGRQYVANAAPYGLIAWHARNVGLIMLRTTSRGTTTMPTFAFTRNQLYIEAKKQLYEAPRPFLPRDFNTLDIRLVLPATKPNDSDSIYTALELDLLHTDRQSTTLGEKGLFICTYDEAADKLDENYKRGHKRATLASYALLQHLSLIT